MGFGARLHFVLPYQEIGGRPREDYRKDKAVDCRCCATGEGQIVDSRLQEGADRGGPRSGVDYASII